MDSLPLDIIIEKNKLAMAGAWTLLLDVTPAGGGTTEYYVRNTEDVNYGGQTYKAANFEIDASKTNAEGEIPQMELTLADPARVVRAWLESNNGGVGATVRLTPVNTSLLTKDWSNLTRTHRVSAATDDAENIVFTMGGPMRLQTRVPPDSFFGDYCRFHYGQADTYLGCSLTPFTVAGVTLSGTDPVSIEVTGHPFVTGDGVTLAGIADVTPSLAGAYTVTKVDANNFTLNSTDSSDYSGSYTSGGTAVYTACKRCLSDCRLRNNSARFGGYPGQRAQTIVLV